jgi:hypothetical protein
MDLEDLDTRSLLVLLFGRLCERVETHPMSTLAGAASLGYVVGWSMPKAVLSAAGSLALRTVMMQVVYDLFGFGEDERPLLHAVRRA